MNGHIRRFPKFEKTGFMKRDLLLPYGFKKVGWAILVPTALLGLTMWADGFNGVPGWFYSLFGISTGREVADPAYLFWSSGTMTRLLNNAALIGVLVGSLLVACSRERVEDEMISRIRLSALLTALYVQTVLTVAAALFLYDFAFLEVMIVNLIALPVLFLVVLHWRLWRLRKEVRDEE